MRGVLYLLDPEASRAADGPIGRTMALVGLPPVVDVRPLQ